MLRNVARDLGAAFEARIDQSLRLELCQRVAIGIEIVRLTPHRLFPADAEPSEILVDRLLELRATARGIDVLDSQQKPPAEVARHLVIDQRRERVAEMQVTIRARREAENGLLHGSSPAGLTGGSIMNESATPQAMDCRVKPGNNDR